MEAITLMPIDFTKLPSNCVLLSAEEFLASVRPSRDIQRVGSKVVMVIHRPSREEINDTAKSYDVDVQ